MSQFYSLYCRIIIHDHYFLLHWWCFLDRSYFLSTPKEGFAITLITFVSYSFIVLLEYFNLLPHKGLFKLTPSLYKNGQYIIATILLTGVAFTLIFITGKNFAQTLKQKNVELTQACLLYTSDAADEED